MTADLPADYPFVPEDKAYPAPLDHAQVEIYEATREHARYGLQLHHFEFDDELAFHEHINTELPHLRKAVRQTADLFDTPGPWHGLTDSTDIALATAELSALLLNLRNNVEHVENAITDALTDAMDDTDHSTAKRWRERRDLEDRIQEDLRDAAAGIHLPLEARLASLDHLVAAVQGYRATLIRQHHMDAWMADRQPPANAGPNPDLLEEH